MAAVDDTSAQLLAGLPDADLDALLQLDDSLDPLAWLDQAELNGGISLALPAGGLATPQAGLSSDQGASKGLKAKTEEQKERIRAKNRRWGRLCSGQQRSYRRSWSLARHGTPLSVSLGTPRPNSLHPHHRVCCRAQNKYREKQKAKYKETEQQVRTAAQGFRTGGGAGRPAVRPPQGQSS